MNQPRRKSRQRRGEQGRTKPLDLWQPRPVLPPLEPIVPSPDPTALFRSLGTPPLHNEGADHYLMAAIARASVLATALAGAAGLVVEAD